METKQHEDLRVQRRGLSAANHLAGAVVIRDIVVHPRQCSSRAPRQDLGLGTHVLAAGAACCTDPGLRAGWGNLDTAVLEGNPARLMHMPRMDPPRSVRSWAVCTADLQRRRQAAGHRQYWGGP